MIQVSDIYNAIDAFAPFETAEAFDNAGVLVDCGAGVGKILFALDATEETVREAKERGCGALVAHHPVMFGGIRRIGSRDPVMTAVRESVSVIAAHTNFDKAAGGINDVLAGLLKLDTVGMLAGGLGRIGLLKEAMAPAAFSDYVKRKLGLEMVAAVLGERDIQTVAVCGGACDLLEPMIEAGADAVVTGEMKHHQGLLAKRYGVTAVAGGHFSTENPGMAAMCDYLQKVFGGAVECVFSKSGRDPFSVV